MTLKKFLAAVAALALVTTLQTGIPALAAGGSSTPEKKVAESPADEAKAHYNAGLAARDQAWALQDRLADAEEVEIEKLHKKIKNNYERAIREYRSAVSKDPKMFQAYSSLGYALRKTEDFRNALNAYNSALEINPEYTEALEYRGEAWLGLNQPELAKKDYTVLVGLNQKHAAELLHSMKNWAASGRAEGEMKAADLEALNSWIAEEMSAIGEMADHSSGKGNW